jgi:hypothetical protein
MDRVRKVGRLIERSPFDADLVRLVLVSVPHAGSASGAKEARERPSAVGRARPASEIALQQPNVRAPDPDRDPECGCRLLPTLPTMAYIDDTWCTRHFVAHSAALAATRHCVSMQQGIDPRLRKMPTGGIRVQVGCGETASLRPLSVPVRGRGAFVLEQQIRSRTTGKSSPRPATSPFKLPGSVLPSEVPRPGSHS